MRHLGWKFETALLMTGAAISALADVPSVAAQQASDATAQAVPRTTAGSAPDTATADIIVTAQRRSERLQSIPAAVTAITGDQMEKLGIQGTTELTQVTPGLNFTQSLYSPQPTIRGIGVRGVGPGDESVVPIYIDGVYQAFIAAADLQFNNVERVEVLKGPQGALFGRNATGGAINIITKTPGNATEGAFSLSYGRFNELIAKGYISGGTDKIAADLAVVRTRDDGYIHDYLRDDTYGSRDDISVRGKLVFRPSDLVDVRLSGGYVKNLDSTGEAYRVRDGNTIGARIPGNPVTTQPYLSTLSDRPFNNLRQYSVALTATFKLSGVDITSISGYQNNKVAVNSDSDATPLVLGTTTLTQTSRNFYQELYATSKGTGPFTWIAGATYFHDVSAYDPFRLASQAVSVAGVISPTVSVTEFHSTQRTDSYAVYAQVAYRFAPQWTLTVGGRYTDETKAFNNVVALPAPGSVISEAKFARFTPTATLQFSPSDRLNIYAKAGQAFKSGLVNGSATTQLAAKPVGPETVTQYEIGFKSDPARWLRVNVSTYYTDYKGLQSSSRDPVTLASVLQNAGSAELYGFEIESFIRASNTLNIRASLAGLHGRYADFPAAQVNIPILNAAGAPIGNSTAFIDARGKTIIRAPSWQANLGADYTIPLPGSDLVISANANYQGKSYWDIPNLVAEPSRVLVNAQVEWRVARRYRLAVWGENLLDEQYSLTTAVSASDVAQVLARPRTYGIRFSYDLR